jgi:hypothetical protein
MSGIAGGGVSVYLGVRKRVTAARDPAAKDGGLFELDLETRLDGMRIEGTD